MVTSHKRIHTSDLKLKTEKKRLSLSRVLTKRGIEIIELMILITTTSKKKKRKRKPPSTCELLCPQFFEKGGLNCR